MNRKKIVSRTGILICICFTYAIAGLLNNDYWVSILILIAINILLASSLRTIFILDQISLGHVGFTLIGAYTSALFVTKAGVSFWAGLLLGGTFSAVVALALGYPFLKLKGIYFCILTFMTAEILRLITYNWRDLTGGMYGIADVPAPAPLLMPGLGRVSFQSMENYYYLTLTIVLICLFMIYTIEQSHLKKKWIAIKDADKLASSVGINIMRYKVINFTVACFFAGLAGALFAHYQRSLSVDITSRFGVMMSLYLVVYMVIGGKDRFAGPITGTIVTMLIMEFARPMGQYRPMLIGAISILVVLLMPDGIVGMPERIKSWVNAR